MKRKSLKSVEVLGLTFQGETITEAKEKGTVEVARLAREANIGPSVYHVQGATVLVWSTLESWCYRILNDSYMQNGVVHASCMFNAFDRAEACADAVFAAAQYQWHPGVSCDQEWIEDAFISVWHTRAGASKKADLEHWVSWQRRYAAVFAVCGDKNMSHDIATRYQPIDSAVQQARKEMGLSPEIA